jgi:hypothetical protein
MYAKTSFCWQCPQSKLDDVWLHVGQDVMFEDTGCGMSSDRLAVGNLQQLPAWVCMTNRQAVSSAIL